eukprot:1160435-Pelagomonas_calceolata.AAC.5
MTHGKCPAMEMPIHEGKEAPQVAHLIAQVCSSSLDQTGLQSECPNAVEDNDHLLAFIPTGTL